jgi:CHASE1-domain containing sensor protein
MDKHQHYLQQTNAYFADQSQNSAWRKETRSYSQSMDEPQDEIKI